MHPNPTPLHEFAQFLGCEFWMFKQSLTKMIDRWMTWQDFPLKRKLYLCFRFFKSWMTIRLHWRLPQQRNTATAIHVCHDCFCFQYQLIIESIDAKVHDPYRHFHTTYRKSIPLGYYTQTSRVCGILWKYQRRGQVLFFRILTAAMSRPMITDIWQSLGLGHVNIN